MSRVHFVTFGCDVYFKNSRARLAKEAAETGWFDKIFIYHPELLESYRNGRDFNNRGAGYWWWKSKVQLLALSQIDDGDLLLYLDAGFHINKHAKLEFDRFVERVTNNVGLLVYNCGNSIEKYWTKRDLFKLLECDTIEYTDSPQIASGAVLCQKNKLTMHLISEYDRLSNIGHAFDDTPSFNQNYDGYVEHRHDQSVFSLLVKKIYKDKDIELVNHAQVYQDDIDFLKKWINDNSLPGIENLQHVFYATRFRDTI
jgi:hypothetical protein